MTNPINRKYTDEQIRELRRLVWRDGLSHRAALRRLGINKAGGSLWKALHGFAYKAAGGPTGKGEKQ